jgi:P27 family predicted phage terminase small subunit
MADAPGTLGEAGRRLWDSVLSDVAEGWELDARDVAYLEKACRCADELASLEANIDADGTMVEGSKGQVRVHPAISEARQLRVTLLRLLGAIELSDPSNPERSATAAQQRGRHAARARWERRERIRG